jgi:hypothetical protein
MASGLPRVDAPVTGTFNPPVHPSGTVSGLKLYGKDIPLASNELRDGVVTTVGFGDVEVLVTGLRGGPVYEYRASPADIAKLKKAYPAQE